MKADIIWNNFISHVTTAQATENNNDLYQFSHRLNMQQIPTWMLIIIGKFQSHSEWAQFNVSLDTQQVIHFKNESFQATDCITGSTVVLTCCKGDSSSQWETPIFGPPQIENPLTDLDKICHQWLRRRWDPPHQIW